MTHKDSWAVLVYRKIFMCMPVAKMETMLYDFSFFSSRINQREFSDFWCSCTAILFYSFQNLWQVLWHLSVNMVSELCTFLFGATYKIDEIWLEFFASMFNHSSFWWLTRVGLNEILVCLGSVSANHLIQIEVQEGILNTLKTELVSIISPAKIVPEGEYIEAELYEVKEVEKIFK